MTATRSVDDPTPPSLYVLAIESPDGACPTETTITASPETMDEGRSASLLMATFLPA